VDNKPVHSHSKSGRGSSNAWPLDTSSQAGSSGEDLIEETLLESPVVGSTELTSSITEAVKSNSMVKTQFTANRYRFSNSRGYCEVYQEISQILIKYPVTTGISQGMADGLTLRS